MGKSKRVVAKASAKPPATPLTSWLSDTNRVSRPSSETFLLDRCPSSFSWPLVAESPARVSRDFVTDEAADRVFAVATFQPSPTLPDEDLFGDAEDEEAGKLPDGSTEDEKAVELPEEGTKDEEAGELPEEGTKCEAELPEVGDKGEEEDAHASYMFS